MNYKKIYIKIIRKAQEKNCLELNYLKQKHHIFPKNIFGENNKIVLLTTKEHILAHHLLWHYYKKKYGTKDIRTKKMLYAYFYMISLFKEQKYDRQKRYIRENFYGTEIVAINIETKEIKYFFSIRSVEKYGFNRNCVQFCLSGKATSHKGYFWKYFNKTNIYNIEIEKNRKELRYKKMMTPIKQINIKNR